MLDKFTRRGKPIRIIRDTDNHGPDKWSLTVLLFYYAIFVQTVYHFRSVHYVVTGDYQVRTLRNVYTYECKKHLGIRCKDFHVILYEGHLLKSLRNSNLVTIEQKYQIFYICTVHIGTIRDYY
jgi:hypothetical protein